MPVDRFHSLGDFLRLWILICYGNIRLQSFIIKVWSSNRLCVLFMVRHCITNVLGATKSIDRVQAWVFGFVFVKS